MAGHELAHNTLAHKKEGMAFELEADAAAVKATCDLGAAKSALTKLYSDKLYAEGQAKTGHPTHPPLETRISNMQNVYDHSDCKAAPTPPGRAPDNAPSVPPR